MHVILRAAIELRLRKQKRLLAHCYCIIVLSLALTLASCAPSTSSELTVTGSTSVTPFAEQLAEQFQHTHPGSAINIQGLGSSAGIRAAIEGVAEIGMSSRVLLTDEANELDQVIIARDALAVVVHPNNPIIGLSNDQIQAIFAGRVRTWNEVGGNAQPITIVGREAGSGTYSAFEELVMHETPISTQALRQGSNGAIRQIVAQDPNAIGYISLGTVDATVRALHIDGITPSIAEVEAGHYQLVRPFLFVWRKNQPLSSLATAFLDYVMSPSGQNELAKAGLVRGAPAP